MNRDDGRRGRHRVDSDDAERLFVMHKDNDDPLRLSDADAHLTPESIREHLETLMAGNLQAPPEAKRLPLDRVSRALIAHEGLDADAVAAIGHAARGIGIRDGDGDSVVTIFTTGEDVRGQRGVERITVHSGPIIWREGVLRVPEELPDTVCAAAAGMPLAVVLSHPALDPLGLTIASAGGRMIRIDAEEDEIEQ